jgi:hypothetical protein
LRPVQQATAPFVELLRAVQAAGPAIAQRGALRPLLDRCTNATPAYLPMTGSRAGIADLFTIMLAVMVS